MPDDRFGDLGREQPERRGPSAAEQLAEMDERELIERGEQPPPRRPTTRYGWVAGVAFFLVVVVVIVNSARNPGRGINGPEAGEPMPEFAVPSATGRHDGDANVAQRDAKGTTPACEITVPDAIKVCRGSRRPIVITFAAKRGDECVDQLNRVERFRRSAPDVAFVGILLDEDRESAREFVRAGSRSFPVGFDRDRQAFNLYRLALCSSIFVHPGGRVSSTKRVPMTDAEFGRELGRIRG